MQAYEGYIDHGRFYPNEQISLPIKASAILVIKNITSMSKRNDAKDFWKRFDKMADSSADEEMPEFPRLSFGREPVILSDEE